MKCQRCARIAGGECCKNAPGATIPEDFGMPETIQLAAALASGRWAVDWWEGDPRPECEEYDQVYFVRPAVTGFEGKIYHPAWGGPCTFLKLPGCELSAEKRPWACRVLEPHDPQPCKLPEGIGNTKQFSACAWLPFQAILSAVADKQVERS